MCWCLLMFYSFIMSLCLFGLIHMCNLLDGDVIGIVVVQNLSQGLGKVTDCRVFKLDIHSVMFCVSVYTHTHVLKEKLFRLKKMYFNNFFFFLWLNICLPFLKKFNCHCEGNKLPNVLSSYEDFNSEQLAPSPVGISSFLYNKCWIIFH